MKIMLVEERVLNPSLLLVQLVVLLPVQMLLLQAPSVQLVVLAVKHHLEPPLLLPSVFLLQRPLNRIAHLVHPSAAHHQPLVLQVVLEALLVQLLHQLQPVAAYSAPLLMHSIPRPLLLRLGAQLSNLQIHSAPLRLPLPVSLANNQRPPPPSELSLRLAHLAALSHHLSEAMPLEPLNHLLPLEPLNRVAIHLAQATVLSVLSQAHPLSIPLLLSEPSPLEAPQVALGNNSNLNQQVLALLVPLLRLA